MAWYCITCKLIRDIADVRELGLLQHLTLTVVNEKSLSL